MSLLLVGCTGGGQEELSDEVQEALPENVEVNSETETIAIDTDLDAVPDAEVSIKDDISEVVLDIDEVEAVEDFCIPGSTFEYAGDDGIVDSKVIGLTMYKGSEFCQAESTTVIESPAGQMTAETTYYFDNTYSEFWVITSINSDMMPAPQVQEIHIVDGQVQS